MEAVEQLIYAGELTPLRDRMIAELADVNTLCATYRSRIYRYALLSLRDPDLAETVTQDCFLRAYKARDDFRGDCSVATWLTRIATGSFNFGKRRTPPQPRLAPWPTACVRRGSPPRPS
jgi:DNA-directed RNA polymerase specialized sigma24 family protein